MLFINAIDILFRDFMPRINDRRVRKTRWRTIPLVLIPIVLVALFLLIMTPRSPHREDSGALGGVSIVLYATPTCGCCGEYTKYLRSLGADVEVRYMGYRDLEALKKSLGIPETLWSCHTSLVGGYYVEGHVPGEAIRKLIDEKPSARGIALPGMPSGSPGMPGPKEALTIYIVLLDGNISVFSIL